jgi:hypothetical protein
MEEMQTAVRGRGRKSLAPHGMKRSENAEMPASA